MTRLNKCYMELIDKYVNTKDSSLRNVYLDVSAAMRDIKTKYNLLVRDYEDDDYIYFFGTFHGTQSLEEFARTCIDNLSSAWSRDKRLYYPVLKNVFIQLDKMKLMPYIEELDQMFFHSIIDDCIIRTYRSGDRIYADYSTIDYLDESSVTVSYEL